MKTKLQAMRIVLIMLLGLVQVHAQTVYQCNTSASCGCSTNPASLTRIVGGEGAGSATWNWAVSILIGGSALCGGSIINESWVLTAAHCVYLRDPSAIRVYAGSLQRFGSTQSREVSDIVVFPGYNSRTFINDIALLKVVPPWRLNDSYVGMICLPNIDNATLAAGEWPVAATPVRMFLLHASVRSWSLGRRCRLGPVK